MKKIAGLFVITLSISLPSFCQKCKYDTDETDKFSGAVKKVIEKTMLKSPKHFAPSREGIMETHAIWFKIKRDDKIYSLEILCARNGRKLESIGSKDSLFLRLENNTLVKLSPNDYNPKYRYNNTDYILTYKLSPEQTKALSLSPISDVRIKLDEVVDFETRGSRGEKFMEAVACIMK